ncbi:MAG: hypothetical protein ACE5PT_06455 [Gemmatimonadales bacterium]
MSGSNGGKPRLALKRPELGDSKERPTFPDFAHMNLDEGFEWPAPLDGGTAPPEEEEA